MGAMQGGQVSMASPQGMPPGTPTTSMPTTVMYSQQQQVQQQQVRLSS